MKKLLAILTIFFITSCAPAYDVKKENPPEYFGKWYGSYTSKKGEVVKYLSNYKPDGGIEIDFISYLPSGVIKEKTTEYGAWTVVKGLEFNKLVDEMRKDALKQGGQVIDIEEPRADENKSYIIVVIAAIKGADGNTVASFNLPMYMNYYEIVKFSPENFITQDFFKADLTKGLISQSFEKTNTYRAKKVSNDSTIDSIKR